MPTVCVPFWVWWVTFNHVWFPPTSGSNARPDNFNALPAQVRLSPGCPIPTRLYADEWGFYLEKRSEAAAKTPESSSSWHLRPARIVSSPPTPLNSRKPASTLAIYISKTWHSYPCPLATIEIEPKSKSSPSSTGGFLLGTATRANSFRKPYPTPNPPEKKPLQDRRGDTLAPNLPPLRETYGISHTFGGGEGEGVDSTGTHPYRHPGFQPDNDKAWAPPATSTLQPASLVAGIDDRNISCQLQVNQQVEPAVDLVPLRGLLCRDDLLEDRHVLQTNAS